MTLAARPRHAGTQRIDHAVEQTGRPDLAAPAGFLAGVDSLLAGRLLGLAESWQGMLGEQAAVVAAVDVPALIGELVSAGGKRIRPAMVHLGWLAASGRPDPADPALADVLRAGAALELLHVFGLVHDDVMDESATRRGRPAVHARMTQLHTASDWRGGRARFGETVAVLVGDLAHAEADALAAELPPGMRDIWRTLVVELMCGQLLDVVGSATGRRDPGYATMAARMKSGRYTVERPLELGAAAAGAGSSARRALADYGQSVGAAFAVRDDVLGVWGEPALTGKPAGDDLISGKPTLLLSLAGRRLTSARGRELLDRAGSTLSDPDEVAELQELMREAGVADEAEAVIAGHLAAALAALESPAVAEVAVGPLTEAAQQIAWRQR